MAQALKFMIGTQGKPDYLVLAKHGKVSFGLKGLVRGLPDGFMFLMVRFRSGLLNSDVIDTTNPPDVEAHHKMWNVQFDQCSAVRASGIACIALRNVETNNPASVWAALNCGVADEFVKFFVARGIKTTVDPKEVTKALVAQWAKSFNLDIPKVKKAKLPKKAAKPRMASQVIYIDQMPAVTESLKEGESSPIKAADHKTFKKTLPKAPPKLKVVKGGKDSNVVSMAEVKAKKAKAKAAKKPKLKLIKKAPAKKKAVKKAVKKAPEKKAKKVSKKAKKAKK